MDESNVRFCYLFQVCECEKCAVSLSLAGKTVFGKTGKADNTNKRTRMSYLLFTQIVTQHMREQFTFVVSLLALQVPKTRNTTFRVNRNLFQQFS